MECLFTCSVHPRREFTFAEINSRTTIRGIVLVNTRFPHGLLASWKLLIPDDYRMLLVMLFGYR
jgi:hypothetical protein